MGLAGYRGTYDLERVFYLICDHKSHHDGNAPTRRELVEAIPASSTSVVTYLLEKLEDQGRIKLDDGDIEVVGAAWHPPSP